MLRKSLAHGNMHLLPAASLQMMEVCAQILGKLYFAAYFRLREVPKAAFPIAARAVLAWRTGTLLTSSDGGAR